MATRGASTTTTPTKKKAEGSYINNRWQCACTPSLPAKCVQTRKAGPNEGRWFWTCPKKMGDVTKCNFFNWADAGPPLPAASSMSIPPPSEALRTPLASNASPLVLQNISTPPPQSYSAHEQKNGTSRKRRRVDGGVEDSSASASGSFSVDEDLDLDQPSRTPGGSSAFTTPRKPTSTNERGSSGRRRFPWDPESTQVSIPTPTTGRKRRGSPIKHAIELSPDPTPTSSMFRDSNTSSQVSSDTLVSDVLGALSQGGVNLDDATAEVVKKIMSKHVFKTAGVVRGRDLSRLSLKTKEAKISELQYRIASLEAELEEKNAVIANMEWENANGMVQ